jgi:hypothetical protein
MGGVFAEFSDKQKANSYAPKIFAQGKMRGNDGNATMTTQLSAQDRVILFCVATGIDHAAIGILTQAMQSMALRGFVEHDRATGDYTLTDSGRATLAMILDHAGIKVPPK